MGTNKNMEWDEEFDQFQSLTPKKMSRMIKIIIPHMYEASDNIYGYNKIPSMVMDAGYDMNLWPGYVKPALASGNFDPITAFYIPLLDKMIKQYFEYAFKEHGYLPYDDIKALPVFDISRMCEGGHSFPTLQIQTTDDDRNIAMQCGSGIFLPCAEEYLIRFDRVHMLYVKLLENDGTIATIQFDDYVVKSRNVSCIQRFIISSRYDPENENIDWSAKECTVYEEFLSRDIDKMGWTSEEEQFWCDCFGISKTNSPVMLSLPLVFDTENTLYIDASLKHWDNFIIWKQQDADWIANELRKLTSADIPVVERGQKILTMKAQSRIEDMYPKILKAIATVNVQLKKSGITEIKPKDNMAKIDIGDMMIRTKVPVEILLKP